MIAKYPEKTIRTFFTLVRAGLWEQEVQLLPFCEIDYFAKIKKLAEEQSVIGLVAAGLDHVQDIKVPKKDVLQIIGQTLQLEQNNQAMNYFIGVVVDKMRKEGIYTLLVKGQGVAQCYERPLWRSCGDVDFLLSSSNYAKAKKYLIPLASSVDQENKERMHQSMVFDPWVLELHGTLHTRQLPNLNNVIDSVQEDIFNRGAVRAWENGGTTIYLPSPDNDVFIIFSHIIQHFFGGGIGLRQICDLCRLLWTYRNSINVTILEQRLREARVFTEWKAFASLSVEWLGMPAEAMPFYSVSGRWSRKANRLISFILKTGNFGHNRESENHNEASSFRRNVHSLLRYTCDAFTHLFIFPIDSLKVWFRMVTRGISEIV